MAEKGNQVEILDSPAAVSSIQRFKLRTKSLPAMVGRLFRLGVSQKTCRNQYATKAFEEKAGIGVKLACSFPVLRLSGENKVFENCK